MRVWLAIAILLTLSSAPVSGRDIFVSNRVGNDRHDGRATQSAIRDTGPVRTIGRALRLAQSGDRIVLENTGEPYRESLSLIGSRHSGGHVSPLVIEGNGAILDGTMPIPTDQWEHLTGDVFAYRPGRLGYQQLFLAGRPAVRHPTDKESPRMPRLAPREWCLWQGRILLRVDEGRLPDDYDVACCGLQTGITLYYVQDVLIRDLVVQGFAVDGIAVHDVVRETRLERVTCCDNALAGVSVRGASWLELDRCRLVGNGQSQLRVEDFARCWLFQCQLERDEQSAIQRLGGEVFESAEPYSRDSR